MNINMKLFFFLIKIGSKAFKTLKKIELILFEAIDIIN